MSIIIVEESDKSVDMLLKLYNYLNLNIIYLLYFLRSNL